MDDTVLRGMAKWPNVPAVYGWLALDRRGQWLLKGERIGNTTITAFIARNYEQDARGCWYFQNGPQRVFVELAYTPFVYRVEFGRRGAELTTTSGARVRTVLSAWVDEEGSILLDTELGVGLIHEHDIDAISAYLVAPEGPRYTDDDLLAQIEQLQRGAPAAVAIRLAGKTLPLASIRSKDVPARFHFVPRPSPPGGEPTGA